MDVSWQDDPCFSGMVDTGLQNVTAGGCNGVIRLSSVDTTMLKNDSMTYFLPKLSSSHFCLLLLVIVFLFLSKKIPENEGGVQEDDGRSAL